MGLGWLIIYGLQTSVENEMEGPVGQLSHHIVLQIKNGKNWLYCIASRGGKITCFNGSAQHGHLQHG